MCIQSSVTVESYTLTIAGIGNPYKITVNHCRLNMRRNIFSERVVVALNSLPPSAVNFSSLRVFRKTVTNANLKLFTKYERW